MDDSAWSVPQTECWAEMHSVKLDVIKPRKPAKNTYIEQFNRTYRNEVLDYYLFASLTEDKRNNR